MDTWKELVATALEILPLPPRPANYSERVIYVDSAMVRRNRVAFAISDWQRLLESKHATTPHLAVGLTALRSVEDSVGMIATVAQEWIMAPLLPGPGTANDRFDRACLEESESIITALVDGLPFIDAADIVAGVAS